MFFASCEATVVTGHRPAPQFPASNLQPLKVDVPFEDAHG